MFTGVHVRMGIILVFLAPLVGCRPIGRRKVKEMQTDFKLPNYFKCPYCDSKDLWLEVTEWETDTGIPTEAGCMVSCGNEDEEDGPDHYYMPYVYWLPLTVRVYAWAKDNIAIGPSRDDLLEQKRAFEAGEPIRVVD